MFRLKNKHQNYKWGVVGKKSLVAQYASNQNEDINQNLEYAEYWMGTHPNAPSEILVNDKCVLLKDYLNKNLSFLFKVLSINKPLSIQVHPDDKKAKYLNSKYPNRYLDNTRKPEMAVILSEEFEMFYGIISLSQANDMLKSNSDIKEILERSIGSKIKDELINEDYFDLLNQILYLSKEQIKTAIDSFISLNNTQFDVNYLFNEFSYDRGIIFSLFMNKLTLKKGNCVYITENIPHSYIKGDIVECMVTSDFVIRLGLTPKETDAESFSEILKENFEKILYYSNITQHEGNEIRKGLIEYSSELIPEFKILKVNEYANDYISNSNSILLVESKKDDFLINIKGKTVDGSDFIIKNIKPLETYFISKGTELSFEYSKEKENNVEHINIYIATSLLKEDN